ncbi:hypothetical protein [Streptomyces erythrochromogenes]|uniref:hypothetical protein n=1 Tax=Streptomyces erythrochromogenes TaxID=285574 RepID=UPI0002E77140
MKNVQIITEEADRLTEDGSLSEFNEFIWAGYLIDGEMRWIRGYDFEEDYFPGHKPLIICTQAEFQGEGEQAAYLPIPHKAVEAR